METVAGGLFPNPDLCNNTTFSQFKVESLSLKKQCKSVLARQPSRAADSLLRSSRGGGRGPPLCIGKQEVGTYIYSLLYTYTGLLGRLLLKFYSC